MANTSIKILGKKNGKDVDLRFIINFNDFE